MAFPQTLLPITVELDLDGAWTDISSYVYERDAIRIQRGRSNFAGEVDPGSCSMLLKNHDGRFSPTNPVGAYYGLIGRNTPIRVSVDAGDTYLAVDGGTGNTEGASTPDAAAIDITGDIDIRFDATLENWLDDGSVELCGKGNQTGNQRSWLLIMRDKRLQLEWSTAGATTIEADCTEDLPMPPSRRVAVRVTLDVNNGAGGYTVRFYTAPNLEGDWTQLGEPVTAAGVTSIFNSNAGLRVGDGWSDLAFATGVGKVHAFELRSSIGGTIVANPDFRIQDPGDTSFVDAAGLTWTVGASVSLSNKKIRFLGEIASWELEWNTGGTDVYTRIEAQGLMRRLKHGNGPLQSTLRKRIPSDPSLVAYWPMEEGQDATVAFSPIPGVRPMTTHNVAFHSIDTLAGSDDLPTLAGATGDLAQFIGKVPTFTSTSQWRVEHVFFIETIPATLYTMLRIVVGSGTIREWYIQIEDTGATVLGRDEDGANLVNTSAVWGADGPPQGDWYRMAFTNVTAGASIDWALTFIKVDEDAGQISGTQAGTIGKPTAVSGPPAGFATDLNGMAFGHMAVFTDMDTEIFNFADHGYNEELAGDRVVRLTEEEEVPLSLYGPPAITERMGPQLVEELMVLLQECADADQGVLAEDREAVSLAFIPRTSLYDQPAALTLDYESDHGLVVPLSVVYDDQNVYNDWTVQRARGATARVELESGPLSVLAPPDGIGRSNNQQILNLASDMQAEHAASWLLHLTTVDEPRYSTVRVLLQRGTVKIEEASTVDVGSRLQITNPPDWLPPETIDLLAQGYTELIHQYAWEMEFTCTPASPYTAAHIAETDPDDDAPTVRVDTAGTTLNEALDTTETGVDIITTADYRWADSATYASDFPFDIMVGGERMTVSACTGTGLTQSFTVTRSVNGVVKSHASGADVRLFNPPIAVL